jgi:POT family proton-dependent oligopeptide transporter
MLVAAVTLPVRYLWLATRSQVAWSEAIMPCAIGAIAAWMGLTLARLRGASKDKSVVIFVLFAFAVLFWMAFEQAGNALNLWAEFHTRLAVGPFRYPAEWWQSVNAVFIVLLAPLFARAWTWLGERGKEPSTPAKMFIAMIFMALSFGAMVVGAKAEEGTSTEQALSAVPPGVQTQPLADGRLVVGDGDAGRLTFDPATHRLQARGALPRYVVNHVLIRAAPADFVAWVDRLEEATRDATAAAPVVVPSPEVPPWFETPFNAAEAREKGIEWANGSVAFRRPIESPTRTELAAAGAPPGLRDALRELERRSADAKVSGVWLLLSYLFATIGELCLSPVGLSMVTKLAPLRYASVFMGVWMLASSVGQYAGGSIGESWGIISPTQYFTVFVWTSIAGAAVLAVLVGPLRRMMHDVR